MRPNYFGGLSPSSTPGLLSLTSGGRKNKTELDDRRLTLCHAKVGEDKSINQQNLQIIGDANSSV